jgi:hypothetical protein
MLDELGDPVQGKPGLEIAEITGPYLEGLPLGGDTSARQSAAQRLVDDLAERPTGPARFRLELGRQVWVCLKKATDYRHSDRKSSTSGVWQ